LTPWFEFESGDDTAVGYYISLGAHEIELDEISEGNDGYIRQPNIDTFSVLPDYTYVAPYEGIHTFDLRFELSFYDLGYLTTSSGGVFYIRLYLQINDETPIALATTDYTAGTRDSTVYFTNSSYSLNKGDRVRIYGEYDALEVNMDSDERIVMWGSHENIFPSIDPNANEPIPSGEAIPSYIRITANTVHPQNQAEGYLIHDLIHGVLARLGLGTNPLYSEFLGSTLTNARQYDSDGCGWPYVIIKGLQLRGYTLDEKPFFISFRDIWNGINPILNLGLSYEISEDSPDYQYIRIEQKAHFLSDTTSINFSNVREISSSYDQNMIFKTIKVGYKKWQAEDISGIDDPQTKRTYATRFEKVGRELNLESEFIAASYAIETTRRTTREKSADYKYDNDNFIIALNQDDVSPDVYAPELDENFDSVTNLNNSDTRYNLILTPLRNFLRWANFIGGCLQSYTTSSYKFVSGEGNYDMVSDYSCAVGDICQSILCDSLSESQDISLSSYNGTFGYLHLPLIYNITIPMEWDEYETIRNNRKLAIGISQTDTGHIPFKIQSLEYDIIKGQANIKAWPKTFLSITVPDQDITTICNNP
jgi:hypothetical protein